MLLLLAGALLVPFADRALAQDLSLEDRARIEGYVQLLGDDSAAVRDDAERALVALGEPVRTFVSRALTSPSSEVRRRARSILTRLDDLEKRATGDDLVWAGLRGGPERSGVAGRRIPALEPKVIWSVDVRTPELIQGAVVPGRERVACLSGDGVVRCYGRESGDRRWLAHLDTSVSHSAVLAGERLVVPTGRGLTALDMRTGRVAWEHRASYGSNAAPAVVGGRVYAAFRNDGIKAFDLDTGEQVFTRRFTPSGALLADGNLVVAGTEDGKLVRIDPESGRRVWSLDIGSAPNMGPTLAAPGVIVVLSSHRYLRAITADRGRLLWERRVPATSRSESLSASAGRLLLTDNRGAVRCFDAATGRVLWQRFEGLVEIGGPCVTPERVLFGSRGRLICRNADSGDFEWRLDLDVNDNAVPVVRDGTIYLLTDSKLLAFK